MTAKDYYNKTRLVPTTNWTLEMTLTFAEEYHESKQSTKQGMVLDWMDGSHKFFDTINKATNEYNERLSKSDEEIDISLFTVEAEFNNID